MGCKESVNTSTNPSGFSFPDETGTYYPLNISLYLLLTIQHLLCLFIPTSVMRVFFIIHNDESIFNVI